MTAAREYRWVIDVFTPETLPMARLAEYMRELASLFGEHDGVHFAGLERGSAVLVSHIDEPAAPKVAGRILGLRDGSAAEDVRRAYRQLDAMLERDNAVGRLLDGSGAEMIAFPGRTRSKPPIYGPFNQDGTLDGVLIRIGGRDAKTVYAHLDDGTRQYKCVLARALAKQMAAHLFCPLRVTGRGRWLRDVEGHWNLERFRIFSFDPLESSSLLDVVARLRAVSDNDWRSIENPLKHLKDLRGNDD